MSNRRRCGAGERRSDMLRIRVLVAAIAVVGVVVAPTPAASPGEGPYSLTAVALLGSDGTDGNSPAAGAYVDQTTLERARLARLDPARALREASTYKFFKRLNDDFTTGPTGTNVRDLYLLLTGPVTVTRRTIDPLRVPGP